MELTPLQIRMLQLGIEELAKAVGMQAHDFGEGKVLNPEAGATTDNTTLFFGFGLKEKPVITLEGTAACATETQIQTA